MSWLEAFATAAFKVRQMVKEVPIGNNKRFLVKMDGSPFAGFDDREGAETYVKMMVTCKKGGKKGDNAPKAACADHSWTIEERKV